MFTVNLFANHCNWISYNAQKYVYSNPDGLVSDTFHSYKRAFQQRKLLTVPLATLPLVAWSYPQVFQTWHE